MDMQCAVFHRERDLRLERRTIRDLSGDECLIRVMACGICGTDVHAYLGETTYVTRPIILGHEFSGQIVQVGMDIAELKPGDRVTVEPNVECGKCAYCREGNVRLCQDNRPYGINRDGAFAEYVIVREDRVFAIPDSLSFEEAAFVEPLSNVVNGIHLAEINPGDAVVIVGGGPAGLLFTQLAKAVGADPVILVTRGRWKADLSRQMGADYVLHPNEVAVREEVLRITSGQGADAAIEAVGGGFAVELCFSLIKSGGKAIVYGVPPEVDEFSIPAFDFLTHGKQILSCWLNPFCFARTVDVLAKGLVNVTPLLTHRLPLRDVVRGLEMMIEKPAGFLKAQVSPWGD